MKRTARELSLEVLLRIEEEKAYSNLLLNSILQKEKVAFADRGLITEIIYGTITWRDRLDYTIQQYLKGRIEKLEKWVLVLLRLSFYQLMFLDRIPSYAVVNEAVNLAKKRGHQGISSMVNGILRGYLRNPQKAALPANLDIEKQMALEFSHPLWLVHLWNEAYGIEVTREICKANNDPHPMSIRVNQLKLNREQLIKQFEANEIMSIPSEVSPDGLRIIAEGNPVQLPEYEKGLFTIQDESSMLVAKLLQVQEGMRVLDACAAPGGKTTHIAELMNDHGEIIANEIHPHKERLIQEQARRLGISMIKTHLGDAMELPQLIEGSFDRILLDAPCSGFGVIRRKPDLKWNKEQSDIKAIAALQYDLLSKLAPLLKSGGKLIYSTCTIIPEENEKLIQCFLENHPTFKLDEQMIHDLPYEHLKSKVTTPGMLQILPQYWNSDGFFIARIQLA